MNRLKQMLEDNSRLVAARLEPPAGSDPAPAVETARGLAPLVDLLVISDHPGGRPGMDGLALLAALGAAGVETPVLLAVSCAARNRLGLAGRVWGGMALGAAGLLVVSGDHPSLGPEPGAMGVYDLDSVQALRLAADLKAEAPAERRPVLACAVNPLSRPFGLQLMKLTKKLQMGAQLVLTPALADPAVWAAAAGDLTVLAAPVLVGLEAPPDGVETTLALARELAGAAHPPRGFCLDAPGRPADLVALAQGLKG